MKNKDLVYELLEEINDTEVAMIEKGIEESVDDVSLKRQENMVLQKIHEEQMKTVNAEAFVDNKVKYQKELGFKFKKRKLIVLVAVAVMMFSMVAFARANDWDMEFAKVIGLNGVMEELDGGYVKIDEANLNDGITVIAVQSIGDQMHQWIQIDTNIPWTATGEGYYMFEQVDAKLSDFFGDINDCSYSLINYNNNGQVSFIFQVNTEHINRAKVCIQLGKLYQYEDKNENSEKILISDGRWELEWKNYYAANTITKHPMVKIDDLLVHTIKISPISIRVEVTGTYSREDDERLNVEKIILQDGTIIECSFSNGGNLNGMFLESESFYGDNICLDIDSIVSVIINGEEIKIK